MIIEPPQGSKIKVSEEGLERVIRIYPVTEEAMRWALGFILLLFLGIWLHGVYEDIKEVISRKGDIFVIIPAVTRLALGLGAGYLIFAVFRPFSPETLRMKADSVDYDSGRPPFHLEFDFDEPKGFWKPILPKRTWITLEKPVLQTLALREFKSGNRLTVDYNAQRIDIAKTASEVEREWLYGVLKQSYS